MTAMHITDNFTSSFTACNFFNVLKLVDKFLAPYEQYLILKYYIVTHFFFWLQQRQIFVELKNKCSDRIKTAKIFFMEHWFYIGTYIL